jgi:hypothetical protein
MKTIVAFIRPAKEEAVREALHDVRSITGTSLSDARGFVMESYFNELRREGMKVADAVIEGAVLRLRPVLITASVAALGLIPMLFATGPGSEIQKPLAAVVIGGLVSSTLLTLYRCRRSTKFLSAAGKPPPPRSTPGTSFNPRTHMKSILSRTSFAALAAATLSGCLNLTPPATSEQSHGVALETASSARVQVNGPRFQMNHGVLELAGSASKKPGGGVHRLFPPGYFVLRPCGSDCADQARCILSPLDWRVPVFEPVGLLCRETGDPAGRHDPDCRAGARRRHRGAASLARQVHDHEHFIHPETQMKPRSSSVISAVLALFSLAGCATPFRAPRDVAHIKLERADSPVVIVEKIWLERKNGPLVVTGYLLKRMGATDTTHTHLDVTLFDATDHVLRKTTGPLDPPQIPRGRGMHGHSRYRVTLDPLPPETSRIEVRAHEGDIAAPHG